MRVEPLPHEFEFDPTYGYNLEALLQVGAPQGPEDLVHFWEDTYRQALHGPLNITRRALPSPRPGFDVFEIEFDSWGGVRIGGWMTVPTDQPIERGVVVSHGYGGRSGPDLNLPGPPAAAIFPCARGLAERSVQPGIPIVAGEHVLVGIESRGTYIHRGCVADVWCAASALLELVPEAALQLDYMGGSFGGGIGAMALPWDNRFHAASLGVPSFGNHALRVTMPCVGSGESVRQRYLQRPEVLEVMAYFDAASIARHITVPVLCDCALFDPAVPPPGQFAVYNAVPGRKELFVRRAGHFACPEETAENQAFNMRQAAWFRGG